MPEDSRRVQWAFLLEFQPAVSRLVVPGFEPTSSLSSVNGFVESSPELDLPRLPSYQPSAGWKAKASTGKQGNSEKQFLAARDRSGGQAWDSPSVGGSYAADKPSIEAVPGGDKIPIF